MASDHTNSIKEVPFIVLPLTKSADFHSSSFRSLIRPTMIGFLYLFTAIHVAAGLRCAKTHTGKYKELAGGVCAVRIKKQCAHNNFLYTAVDKSQITKYMTPDGCRPGDAAEMTCFCNIDHCNRNFTYLKEAAEKAKARPDFLKCLKNLEAKLKDAQRGPDWDKPAGKEDGVDDDDGDGKGGKGGKGGKDGSGDGDDGGDGSGDGAGKGKGGTGGAGGNDPNGGSGDGKDGSGDGAGDGKGGTGGDGDKGGGDGKDGSEDGAGDGKGAGGDGSGDGNGDGKGGSGDGTGDGKGSSGSGGGGTDGAGHSDGAGKDGAGDGHGTTPEENPDEETPDPLAGRKGFQKPEDSEGKGSISYTIWIFLALAVLLIVVIIAGIILVIIFVNRSKKSKGGSKSSKKKSDKKSKQGDKTPK